jgi:hypothetical protein
MRPLFLGLVVVTAHAVTAGIQAGSGWEEPSAPRDEEAALPLRPPPGLDEGPMRDVLERNRPQLLGLPGVVGVGSGRTADGEDAVLVWLTDRGTIGRIPSRIEDHPVVVHVVAEGFRPF